jgi:peptide deformylase
MSVRTVLEFPDPRLKQLCAPVVSFDAALRGLLRDLDETMRGCAHSVGIAAPQVGECIRAVVVDVSSKADVSHHGCLWLVNPEIVSRSGEVRGREGCMSVPHYTGNVLRAKWIRLRAQDPDGERHEWECEDYEARAVQHELDHLDGVLFLDRVVSPRHDLFRRKVFR